ncbi:hypothetical protein V500_01317 [Pseudogymnoascus sp. VKM F-4518 (FW-2643)]|nr:hypothetical protein V500_01317 [Pseudogymnoascus sp. VKM F-4518 (FW-2643)]
MSTTNFNVKEHVVEAQHIREYARATSFSQEEILHIAVKQYTPLDNPNPQPGDVTIIGAHANGFPKELYEALWDELYLRSKANGFRIRSIWIADAAHQNQSSVLNEEKLGNDPSWMDHPRDLLHMVNHFRKEMPLPLFGVGHSFGGNNLACLALIHPRLFTSLTLLDPVIVRQSRNSGGGGAPIASTFRRDLWPSREAAAAGFGKSSFYQSWDPRVLEAWSKHGLRETPTLLYPNERGSVTLTTTKHNEVQTFIRPLFSDPINGPLAPITHYSHPDVDPSIPSGEKFYSPAPPMVLAQLEHLRPSVLYIFGGTSFMASPPLNAEKMRVTGTGTGGSGGAAKGRVKEVVLEGVGHLIAMEAPVQAAENTAKWIGQEMQLWRQEAEKFAGWAKMDIVKKQVLGEKWERELGGDPRKRKVSDSPAKL